MKWYSVKKHKVPSGVELLVRAQSTGSYERYFIAILEDSEEFSALSNWDMCNTASHDIDFEHYAVTHFCILDPVEIESDLSLKINNLNSLLSEFYANEGNGHHIRFPERAIRCLRAENISTINQLLSWCDHRLLRIPNFGKVTLTAVKKLLAKQNLFIGQNHYYRNEEWNGDTKCGACKEKEGK